MTREGKQIAIILIGLAVIAVVLPMNLKKVKKAAPPPAADQTAQTAATMTAEAKRAGGLDIFTKEKTLGAPPSEEVLQYQRERKRLTWRRDPFSKPSKAVVESEDVQINNISVTGIVMKENVGMAVINDDVVGVGDSIGGYKVKVIKDGSVVLEKEGKEYTIKLER